LNHSAFPSSTARKCDGQRRREGGREGGRVRVRRRRQVQVRIGRRERSWRWGKKAGISSCM
jgi:hypothetical protein